LQPIYISQPMVSFASFGSRILVLHLTTLFLIEALLLKKKHIFGDSQ